MIEHVIYLDMRKRPGQVPPRVTVRRGESQTQKITANLAMDGSAYTPTYVDARLRVLHEDGTWAVCPATKGTGTASATLPSSCLNGAGRCRLAYFEFSSSSGYSETTEGFELVILENVDGNGSDEAANYDDELLQLWNKWSSYEKQAEAQETARASAEKARETAESARKSAESARATAESARASAESTRVGNESARESAETSRASAESARATAESKRATAESARAAAETARESAAADATAQALEAASGAEKVNATISGTKLTVTDRTGASTTVDTKGEKGDTGAQGLPGAVVSCTSGEVGFYIDDDGHLVCVKSDDVADSFSLGTDGHLYLAREL